MPLRNVLVERVILRNLESGGAYDESLFALFDVSLLYCGPMGRASRPVVADEYGVEAVLGVHDQKPWKAASRAARFSAPISA